MDYSGGLNTKHWNNKHIGITNILKFGFPIVQKQIFSNNSTEKRNIKSVEGIGWSLAASTLIQGMDN